MYIADGAPRVLSRYRILQIIPNRMRAGDAKHRNRKVWSKWSLTEGILAAAGRGIREVVAH